MIDAKKAEKKAKNQAKRKAKKEALLRVLAYVSANTEDNTLLEDVTLLRPGQRIASTTSKDAIAELFKEEGTVHEDQIFANFKLGRAEMRKIRVNLIKKAKTPEERLWIDFTPENGEYTLKGFGADAPEGWTGYIPVTLKEMELDDDYEEDETDIPVE